MGMVRPLDVEGYIAAPVLPLRDDGTIDLDGMERYVRWIADDEDNICGIRDLRKVSNPAKVDYDDLWDATPQIQTMKQKRIDPDSTEGKALRNQARTLITKTCELVRQAKGHCGIWKVIRNEDGRIVPDVTDQVKARF